MKRIILGVLVVMLGLVCGVSNGSADGLYGSGFGHEPR